MKSMSKKNNNGSGSMQSKMTSNSSNQGGDVSKVQNGLKFVKKPERGQQRKDGKAVKGPEFKKMQVITVDLFSAKATGVQNDDIKWNPSNRDMYTDSKLFKLLKAKLKERVSMEYLEFYDEIEQLLEENEGGIDARINAIIDKHLDYEGDKTINVPHKTRRDVFADRKRLDAMTVDQKREMFDECLFDCEYHVSELIRKLFEELNEELNKPAASSKGKKERKQGKKERKQLEKERKQLEKKREQLRKWKGKLRKTNDFQEKILDHKNATRRSTVLVNSEHIKGMELKLDLDLNDDEEKGTQKMKLPFSNSKGYDSPSASPRGHSPVSSLVSMPYKELKSHPNQEKDLSIKTAIKDRSRKKQKWSSKITSKLGGNKN